MAEFFTAPIAGFLRGWRKARDRHRAGTGATASVAPAPGRTRPASDADADVDYHSFFGKKWDEMEQEDRTRWTMLGWPEANGAEAWDTNDARWGLRGANQKKFKALSPAQKHAAQVLGYTPVTFDDPSSWKGGFISTNTARFAETEWRDMPDQERAYWETLDWDERTWMSDDPSHQVSSTRTLFRKLNRGEKEAALSLGYTPAAWDARANAAKTKPRGLQETPKGKRLRG